MRLHDLPDPRMVALDAVIYEPTYAWSEEPWRSDWLMHAIQVSANGDDACFIAFGGLG
jgi:hypothetical protein